MNQKLHPAIPLLVIEDDHIDVEALFRAFKRADIANPVFVAHSAAEALNILAHDENLTQPCVIVLDINMPRVDGFELLEKLRGDQRLNNSVVFMLTSSRQEKDQDAAYNLNVAGYFTKGDLQRFTGILRSYTYLNDFYGR